MRIFLFIFFILFQSCAGYRFQNRANPFKQYGIKTLAIPMFYNQSTISNIAPAFTKEIYNMLSGFNDLRLVNSHTQSDAVLIGIIDSNDRIMKTIAPGAPRSVENIGGEDAANKRGDFYVPSSNRLNIVLKLIVIKNPTKEEIEFLKSNLSSQSLFSSKIIFRESIPLSQSFTREIFGGEAISVNHTQNRGALRKSIISLSKNATEVFKEMILYAF